jgi:MATE family multidrug resistance protein
LAVALPLLVSTASWTVMNFTDRMFLLWDSKTAFAAALPAAMLQWTIFCLPMGIASYVGTFVAQYYGAGRYERVGAAMAQAVRFSLYVTPILLIGVPLAPHIFAWANHPPELAAEEARLFQTLSFGAGAAVMAAGLTGYFTGLGRTRVVMFGMVFTALLNVVLDWFLIFGKWGFPQMGIVGAGIATVISQWVRVGMYWYWMTRPAERETYKVTWIGPYDGELMWRLTSWPKAAALPCSSCSSAGSARTPSLSRRSRSTSTVWRLCR